jgi:hypothetical protein
MLKTTLFLTQIALASSALGALAAVIVAVF